MDPLVFAHPRMNIEEFPAKESGIVENILKWNLAVTKEIQSVTATWKFEWRDERISEWYGKITATYDDAEQDSRTKTVDVELTPLDNMVTISYNYIGWSLFVHGTFEFSLTLEPIANDKEKADMFSQSECTDAILLVDGKQVHVNRGFLSVHSPYFRVLFSENFKEGAMVEIPINGVSYAKFIQLLSIILPEPVIPKTAEKAFDLLNLADQFDLRAVTRTCEWIIMGCHKTSWCKKAMCAEKYGLKMLMQGCMNSVNTPDALKQIGSSAEFQQLSDKIKASLLDISLRFI